MADEFLIPTGIVPTVEGTRTRGPDKKAFGELFIPGSLYVPNSDYSLWSRLVITSDSALAGNIVGAGTCPGEYGKPRQLRIAVRLIEVLSIKAEGGLTANCVIVWLNPQLSLPGWQIETVAYLRHSTAFIKGYFTTLKRTV